MNKIVCIVEVSRRISYGFLNNSRCLRHQLNNCAHTRPISLWQRNFSSKHDPSQTNAPDISKAIEQCIRRREITKAFDIYDGSQFGDGQVVVNEETALRLLLSLVREKRMPSARRLAEDLNANALLTYPDGADSILYDIFTALGSRNARIDDLNWFIDQLIFSRKYVNAKVLANLMGIHLTERNDLESALALFARIVDKYGEAPWVTPLLKKCIESGRDKDVVAVIELAGKVDSPKSVLLKLSEAYVEVGQGLDAKRVLRSLQLDAGDVVNMQRRIIHHKLRRNVRELDALLEATESIFPVDGRVRIFEALLLLNADANNSQRVQQLCDQMIAERLQPKADAHAIVAACSKRNIELPKGWLRSDPTNIEIAEHELKLRVMLDNDALQEASSYFIDTTKNRKRFTTPVITSLLQKNGAAGCVREMDLLRTVIPDKIKWAVQFYDNEILAYMKADRHMEYVEVVQWEIGNQQQPSLSGAIVDLLVECPAAYKQLLELTRLYHDRAEIIRLVCLLWAYNFIQNVNLADNDRMWYAHMKKLTSVSVSIVTDVLYQRQRIDKLREFMNSGQYEKRRVKPHHLGKCYSRLIDGLLQAGDHAAIKAELKNAAKFISAKQLETETLQCLKEESSEFETIIAGMNGTE